MAKKATKKAKAKAPAAPAAPAPYVSTAVAPAAFTPGTYTSEYADQLNSAVDRVINWQYDPMKDASYQALAKLYGARGNIAAKNSLADAAALNGGYGTSYAVSAAQQARNQYNQELAALIPDLENTAYNRATGSLSALREADNTAYGRFRDTEGDRQWKYTQDYQAYRDREADNQWLYSQNYNAYRDLMSDYQWNKEFALTKKSSSGGGGRSGGGRSKGGGYSGGYSGGGISSGSDNGYPSGTGPNANTNAANEKGKSMTEYYKNLTNKKGGSTTTSKKKKAANIKGFVRG